MRHQELLDYHLGQLDAERHKELEVVLASDPAFADLSGRLGARIQSLLDSGPDPEPVPGLVGRTLQRLSQQEAPPPVLSVPSHGSLRWVDLAVAATVLIAGLGALIPAIGNAKRARANLQCVANLMGLGQGLNSFASSHGRYPAPSTPNAPVGSYMFPLLETNAVSSPAVLTCPTGDARTVALSNSEWKNWMQRPDHPTADCQEFMRRLYSYNPGYDHGGGRYVPISWDERIQLNSPLAADGPAIDRSGRVAPGNSPNHGGHGQYILFTDGSVRYANRRDVAADRDIYLNDLRQLSYGLHERDSVLFPGDACVNGAAR